jgi:hypothetical protein
MSGPGDPQYPYQPYPPQQPRHHQPDAPTRSRFTSPLAVRMAIRPVPRLGVSLAGVGVGLVIVGVLVWSITYIAESPTGLFGGEPGSSGNSRHFLGAIVSLIVIAIGYALATIVQHGPLATAGVTASALGVPVCIEFLTLDLGSGSTQLVNFDATVLGSVAVWLVSYLFVRGTRGHSFYVGLIALVVWDYIIDKVAPHLFQTNSTLSGNNVATSLSDSFHSDLTTVGTVSLVIGVIYYVIALVLDQPGRHGPGTPMALVAFLATAFGIGALASDLKQVGTGVLLLACGLVFAAYGARFDRRFTTWIWAFGAALGAALLVGKAVSSDGGAPLGVALICLGVVFVIGGALLAKALGEPDDVPDPTG